MQAKLTEQSVLGVSILIPVFNFNINQLVKNLTELETILEIEIIIIDDCSTLSFDFNSKDSRVKYIKLEKNIGRSKIRNLLASYANYSHLLFLDCDVMPVSNNYLSNYEILLEKQNEVLYGGNLYNDSPPTNKYLILHWKAGKYKEQKTVIERKKNPYQSFITYNFIISKKIFLEMLFDVNIIGYGHEDTKFGIDLQRKGVKITHIDNPVFHLGLNKASDFVEKSKEAVDNLCKLIISENMGKETKLYKSFAFLKKNKMLTIFNIITKFSNFLIYKNLYSKNPFLISLDILKLQRMVQNLRNYK